MEQCFRKWGLPRTIKADHGRPFGDPQTTSVPELSLWFIGLGIKPEWTRIACPRDNATVERLQRTTALWSEPERCCSVEQLQKRLTQAGVVQREKYSLRRHKSKNRKELYASLWNNKRRYKKENFSINKVYAFLKQVNFVRRVSKSGTFNFFNQSVYVGVAYKYQELTIRLNQKKLCWTLAGRSEEVFASFTADNFCEKQVRSLKVSQFRVLKVTKLSVANK
ncbi:MAG TPA: hypothetical protein VNS32_22085 [Flavisolibacter sp.]|nr:hypothetical protein [Flavisolibacter sp.]